VLILSVRIDRYGDQTPAHLPWLALPPSLCLEQSSWKVRCAASGTMFETHMRALIDARLWCAVSGGRFFQRACLLIVDRPYSSVWHAHSHLTKESRWLYSPSDPVKTKAHEVHDSRTFLLPLRWFGLQRLDVCVAQLKITVQLLRISQQFIGHGYNSFMMSIRFKELRRVFLRNLLLHPWEA